ncbi:MAG: hypothetical protein J3K34DRAFT_141716 [Monoraphidium minutum]|nr:MAG: hypothetical protein J3K34DRAFT_141716 [Monoraphidium minutum]
MARPPRGARGAPRRAARCAAARRRRRRHMRGAAGRARALAGGGRLGPGPLPAGGARRRAQRRAGVRVGGGVLPLHARRRGPRGGARRGRGRGGRGAARRGRGRGGRGRGTRQGRGRGGRGRRRRCGGGRRRLAARVGAGRARRGRLDAPRRAPGARASHPRRPAGCPLSLAIRGAYAACCIGVGPTLARLLRRMPQQRAPRGRSGGPGQGAAARPPTAGSCRLLEPAGAPPLQLERCRLRRNHILPAPPAPRRPHFPCYIMCAACVPHTLEYPRC